MERQPHGTWTLTICVEESDHHSAMQSSDCDQVFVREILAVFGDEMSLNVTRTSPLEMAEQAVSPWLVYVLPVPCELLGTPKAFVAIGTDSPLLAVHITTAAVLLVGELGSQVGVGMSRSLSLKRLRYYVSSDHEKSAMLTS